MSLKYIFITTLLVATGTNAQTRRPLRVVSIMDEPYLMQTEHGNKEDVEYIGFCNDLAKEIFDILEKNVQSTYDSYKIHLANNYGKYSIENGTGGWNGIMGELMSNAADIAIAPLTITEQRARFVDFSTPFQDFQLSILLLKPSEDANEMEYTCFHPFHLYLWLAIFFSIVGLVFISLILEWSFKSSDTHGEGCVNFLKQDSIFKPESVTGKVIRFVFMVFMIITVGAYTASFAAQRYADSRPDISTNINSIKDVVGESEIQAGIIGGGSTQAYLEAAKDEVYRKLLENMLNENSMVENYAQGLEKLRLGDGNFAFLIETPKAEYFKTLVPCDLLTSREEFGPSRGYSIATPKGSPLSDHVNQAILRLKENGKMEKLINSWWSGVGCSSGSSSEFEDEDFDALNLSEMIGLFYFLLAGFILIVIVWIVERQAK